MQTMNIRHFLFLLPLFLVAGHLKGQILSRAEDKFHAASAQYINKDLDQALATVKEGLKIKPDSEKLEALRKLLEQEKKNQQQQQNKDQQKEDKEKQDQNKDQQDQQQKEQQENADKEKEEQNKKEQDEQKQNEQEQEDAEPSKPEDQEEKEKDQQPTPSQRLEDMKMSEEKARMILEAMKNQEMQYLQQQKRKATQPRDRTKPDW